MGTDVVIIIPVFVVVWLLQKDFVQGMTMGAVKG
jgi:ABC-type glycerol-3-phosphate transport system permease component